MRLTTSGVSVAMPRAMNWTTKRKRTTYIYSLVCLLVYSLDILRKKRHFFCPFAPIDFFGLVASDLLDIIAWRSAAVVLLYYCQDWPFERNTLLNSHIRNQKPKIATDVLWALLKLYMM
jgi:hypothetical protein